MTVNYELSIVELQSYMGRVTALLCRANR